MKIKEGMLFPLDGGRRMYRVINAHAVIEGQHHVILTPVTHRRGEPDVRAVKAAELLAMMSSSHGVKADAVIRPPKVVETAKRSTPLQEKPRITQKTATFHMRYGVNGDEMRRILSSMNDTMKGSRDNMKNRDIIKQNDTIESTLTDTIDDVNANPGRPHVVTTLVVTSLVILLVVCLALNGVKPLGIIIDIMLFGYGAHAVTSWIHKGQRQPATARHRRIS